MTWAVLGLMGYVVTIHYQRLKKFQSENGLDVDGIVGNQTKAKLK